MPRHTISNALMMSILAGSAAAQSPVITVRIDDGSVHHRSEMALRASHTTFDIMAAWQEHQTSPVSFIFYNVSTDGYSFPNDAGAVPVPTCWNYFWGGDSAGCG